MTNKYLEKIASFEEEYLAAKKRGADGIPYGNKYWEGTVTPTGPSLRAVEGTGVGPTLILEERDVVGRRGANLGTGVGVMLGAGVGSGAALPIRNMKARAMAAALGAVLGAASGRVIGKNLAVTGHNRTTTQAMKDALDLGYVIHGMPDEEKALLMKDYPVE